MENIFLTSLTAPEVSNLIRKELNVFFKEAKETQSPITDGTPEVLDVSGVAALLKITPATVHDWKRRGMLPYRKKGDRTYFLKSEIIASLDKPEVRRTVKRKKAD